MYTSEISAQGQSAGRHAPVARKTSTDHFQTFPAFTAHRSGMRTPAVSVRATSPSVCYLPAETKSAWEVCPLSLAGWRGFCKRSTVSRPVVLTIFGKPEAISKHTLDPWGDIKRRTDLWLNNRTRYKEIGCFSTNRATAAM